MRVDVLTKADLEIDTLESLSYKSELGVNLKQNLRYFDKESLLQEVQTVLDWYDRHPVLMNLNGDYRIKSIQSVKIKLDKNYPDHQARKVLNDLLGFRILCDNYDEVYELKSLSEFRIADMTKGKSKDDGYRGIHIYYSKE